jgi:hypothetical protein
LPASASASSNASLINVLISPTWPTPRTRVDSFSRCPSTSSRRADEPGTAVVFALGPRAHAVDVSQERHLTAQASRPLNGGRQFTINTAL